MINLDSYSLATDTLFLTGLLFTGLPILTDVLGGLFTLIGIVMSVTAAYSHFRLPFADYVLLGGSFAGFVGGISGLMFIGEYQSGLPVMVILLGLAASTFTLEEAVRDLL